MKNRYNLKKLQEPFAIITKFPNIKTISAAETGLCFFVWI